MQTEEKKGRGSLTQSTATVHKKKSGQDITPKKKKQRKKKGKEKKAVKKEKEKRSRN